MRLVVFLFVGGRGLLLLQTPRRSTRLTASVDETFEKARNYYDYRRRNDGVEDLTLASLATSIEAKLEEETPQPSAYVDVKSEEAFGKSGGSQGGGVVLEERRRQGEESLSDDAGPPQGHLLSSLLDEKEKETALPLSTKAGRGEDEEEGLSSSSSSTIMAEEEEEKTNPAADFFSSLFPQDGDDEQKPRKKRKRADGQNYYQALHNNQLVQGVMQHLRNIQGLGSELETKDEAEAVMRAPVRLTSTKEWLALEAHAKAVKKIHLRDLLMDARRVDALAVEEPATGAYLDWSRQKVTAETMSLLVKLAKRMAVDEKRDQMKKGYPINKSERRAALHFALRAEPEDLDQGGYLSWQDDQGEDRFSSVLREKGGVSVRDAVEQSFAVRRRIWAFADAVRAGDVKSPTGKPFKQVVVVGIGGSHLGPEFVVQALDFGGGEEANLGVRFVPNVDPASFEAATRGLDPKETLVVVVSKSFTTAETMRNSQKVKRWILDAYDDQDEANLLSPSEIVAAHFCACAGRSALPAVREFGVAEERLFEFWDWVGGRYSSCASAGLLPLALSRGSEAARRFLQGARKIDAHFFEAPLEGNVPAIMALLGVWNVNFLGLGARAVVPYAHGLSRFPAHVQQLEMESNGKSVTTDGTPLDYTTGEIVFGEPGTSCQHSFFQLLHMGQCVPCDFLGFLAPQDPANYDDHDELVANLLAQPDALALGRSFEDVVNDVLIGETDDVDLCAHKTLSGDRPSLTLLFPKLDPEAVGAILALYEARTAVQGFVWNINSWDQFGVERGKSLASDIRKIINDAKDKQPPSNPSTARLLERYCTYGERCGRVLDDDDDKKNTRSSQTPAVINAANAGVIANAAAAAGGGTNNIDNCTVAA
mmetsp:Transcript_31843/g.101965  ORF Transcript_31843/g.101965 Transcript_31843/m.101965 type:complete len:877 (+) Transcript_31843:218-2848(+)